MRDILNANFFLHYQFDKLRNQKHKNLLIDILLFLVWFIIWVSIFVFFAVLLTSDSQSIRIIGATGTFLVVLSRFCAFISETLYLRKKERKLKNY